MKKKFIIAICLLACVLAMACWYWFLWHTNVQVLNPKGWIAAKQRNLIVFSLLVMLIPVLPVIFLAFYFARKYRAENTKSKYTPDWDHSHLAELIWWGIPFLIIVVLSIVTVKASFQLDPFKPLDSDKKHMPIQVVALQWKWLFIYPEEKIATVNFVQFPNETPIAFEISGDSPMNSFWIPQLGGQIYSMPGMKTKLHLIANEIGSYRGSSANLSGDGFAGMTFTAKASSEEEYHQWVQSVRASGNSLSKEEYRELAKPSQYNPVAAYVLTDEDLFDWIVMKPMRGK